MAKRKRNLSVAKIIKEGRGTGVGDKYIPGIKIQDVPSIGRVSRIRGIKIERQHELLSDMERDYLLICDYSAKVDDIREQFLLKPIEETILIAKELGIEHPRNPRTGELNVMSTDFLITMNYNNKVYEVARTIKPKDKLMNKRVLEKFEIERLFWEKKEINWGIVTEEEIDKVVVNNISLLHGYKEIRTIDSFNDIESGELKDLIYEFIKRLIDNEKTMRTICNEYDKEMVLEKGSSLCIFKYLVINKIIEIDITKRINVNQYIPIIKIIEASLRKVEAI